MAASTLGMIFAGAMAAGMAAPLIQGRPKAIQAQPRPTRIEAMERADQNDLLARRRGTDANRRVGFGAGEAFIGPKKSLLGR